MATLTNQNQWYDVATAGPYTSTIENRNVTWTNVIQARWTARSGTTYTVQYRCVIRKSSGTSVGNNSSYAGWSIGGTGAATVTGGTSEWIYYNDIGDNQIGITTGTINGTSGTVTGGVRLGYYGSTWGATNLSGSITLPQVGRKLYGSVNGQTKQIRKLYGSVNGQTKLIRKLYGSVNGQTKLIYQG